MIVLVTERHFTAAGVLYMGLNIAVVVMCSKVKRYTKKW
jgi:hypothetical protein